MARFSTRNIFRDKDPEVPSEPNDPREPPIEDIDIELPIPEVEPTLLPEDSIEEDSIENGTEIKEEVYGGGEVSPESVAETTSPLLPTYPTTLAKGTFALPGSKTFRQYQSPDLRAELTGGIAEDDLIRRRLRGSNANRG